MLGNISEYYEKNGSGVIRGDNGEYFPFAVTNVIGKIKPRKGATVNFELNKNKTLAIRIVIHDISKREMPANHSQAALLKEIRNWKLEGKLEDNARYFYLPPDLDQVLNGDKAYVIGRKGVGKTAIAEHILYQASFNIFSKKLTFKNFPFNELYKLVDNKYTYPNQYISAWKYIIYSTIARMMASNEKIEPALRNDLAKLYSESQIDSLSKAISVWTSAKFKLIFLGSGAEVGIGKQLVEQNSSWVDKANLLERILLNNLDDSKYYIVFDELDEDYNSAESSNDYMALLTGLFKAIQDIKSIFNRPIFNVYPVVFIRDDIYRQIKDPDKTKWTDMCFKLAWHPEEIKKMLAFRISRAKDPLCAPLCFPDAWLTIMDTPFVATQKRTKDRFNYISEKTFSRPRDYIHYLKRCAENCVASGRGIIGANTIKKVDNDYSNWFRSEIEMELYGIYPDIEAILSMLSLIRKPIFSYGEFDVAYRKLVNQKKVSERDSADVLEVLYDFSVLGNTTGPHRQKFRYYNAESRFNISESLMVHRGLYASLSLF